MNEANKINEMSYEEFYQSFRYHTKMRESIKDYLENSKNEYFKSKFEEWNPELTWWADDVFFTIPYWWFDENKYVVKSIDANTHKSPDYIFQHINDNNKTIGIEITNGGFLPMWKVSRTADQKEKYIRTIKKRQNENLTPLDRIKKVFINKSKLTEKWIKTNKRGLVIALDSPYQKEKKPDYFHWFNTIVQLNNEYKKFDYLAISFVGVDNTNIKKNWNRDTYFYG